jgi:hypothetical protein
MIIDEKLSAPDVARMIFRGDDPSGTQPEIFIKIPNYVYICLPDKFHLTNLKNCGLWTRAKTRG